MMTISDIIEIIVVCALIFFPLGYLGRGAGTRRRAEGRQNAGIWST